MDEEDSFIEVEQWDVTSLSSNDDEGSYGCDVKTENEDKKCNITVDDTTCNNNRNNNNTTISSLIGCNAGTDISFAKKIKDEAVVDDCSVERTNHTTSNNEQEDDVSMVVEHPRTSITEHDTTTTTTNRSTCTTTTIVVVANDPSMTNPPPSAVPVPCSTVTVSSSISTSTNPTDFDAISTDGTVVTNKEHNNHVVKSSDNDDDDVIVIDDSISTKSKMDDDDDDDADDKKEEERKTYPEKDFSSIAPAVDSVDHVKINTEDVIVVRDNNEDKPVSKCINHMDTPSNNEDKDLSPAVVVSYDPTDLIMNEEDSTDSTCNTTTTSGVLLLKEDDVNSKDSRCSSSTAPMPVLSVVTSKSYGGNGGHAFDSGCIGTSNGCTTIKKIIVNAGAVVDGITLEYNNSSKVFATGGCGGSKESITLDMNEYINKVVVKYNAKIVQSLSFMTNNGKQLGPCGGTSQALFLFCNNNTSSSKTVTLCGPQVNDSDTHKKNYYMLTGMKGRSGVYIDQIAFYWTPIIECTNICAGSTLSQNLKTCNTPLHVGHPGTSTLINSTQLYGGRGGTFFYLCFHDETHSLQRITINAGNVVDGVTVQMMKSKTNNNKNKTSSCTKHVGGNGGSSYSLVLKHNEYINEVNVVFNNRLVQSLTFQTNLGNQLGPCGGSNSGRMLMCGVGGMIHNGYRTVTLKAPTTKHMLMGIRGRAGVYLDAVGVSWGPITS